jgi:hypothetical protein
MWLNVKEYKQNTYSLSFYEVIDKKKLNLKIFVKQSNKLKKDKIAYPYGQVYFCAAVF